MVITVLLLVELDTGQLERTANSQTLAVPEAISGGSRQEEAVFLSTQGRWEVESGGDGWKWELELNPLFACFSLRVFKT